MYVVLLSVDYLCVAGLDDTSRLLLLTLHVKLNTFSWPYFVSLMIVTHTLGMKVRLTKLLASI